MNELRAAWRALRARVEELAERREHYLGLFEQAGEAFLVTDAAGVISEANGAAVGLLQRRRLELFSKPLAALLPLSERRQFRSMLAAMAGRSCWRSLLCSGRSLIEVDIAVRRSASGALLWRLRPVA